jgi:hypothetical protein
MESAVRYDFSFPPKSSNNQMVHNIQKFNGYPAPPQTQSGVPNLPKSASDCKLNKDPATLNNNNMLQNNLNNLKIAQSNSGKQHSVIKPSALGLLQHSTATAGPSMHHHTGIGNAPHTPKDSNCSFTFDDLKNTLAFMEDSPLVKQITETCSNTTIQLMVNPNTTEATAGALSSSSTVSTASSSSSSCNSCCVPESGYLPRSNSNSTLLSVATTSSSSLNSVTPTSPTLSQQHTNIQFNQNTNVLDLFVNKKSPADETISYDQGNNVYLNNSSSNSSLITVGSNSGGINSAVETAAKKYRCAAQVSEATCCWKGKLPPKQYKTPIVYSTKVFVGGLPWDITEDDIVKEFGCFGPCRVEWTNKEKFNMSHQSHVTHVNQQSNNSDYNDGHQQNNNQHGNNGGYHNGYQQHNNNYRNHHNNGRNSMGNGHNNGNMNQLNGSNISINNNQGQQNSDPLNSSKHRLSPGFAYVIYESEYSVRSLVGNCIEDYQNGRDRVEYYFKISTRRVRNKEVQIIPWILADNNFALCTPKELDPKKTVFVGNLHGTMTARDLAHIMNELFGCVVYAGIDIDKLKYPIGSGRVTFSHQQNFMRAVRAAFVDIQSSKFSKRIQIDPYLEDVQCCLCYGDKGIYFCRDFQCFNYYCGGCWEKQHSYNQLGNHKPLMRKREDKQNL